jgi:D-alanyl-D-alanine carboxypeptidase/D-alanyl-D-alanine-endopeptidase (penicillin-binding protein 4)
VRQITGSVVGDDSRYDAERYVAGWPERYLDQNAIGPLSALSVNDGFVRFPGSAADDGPLAPAADPAAHAAAVLTRLLEARGVDVVGEPRSGVAPAGAVEVASIDSAPLREVVGQMLLESDNNSAELLLKEIGRTVAAGSTAVGAATTTDLLAAAGLDLAGSAVTDGSGLSLDDRATCSLLVELLDRTGTGTVLVAELPVAGESGTLTDRFAEPPLRGVLRAKTGSLTSVTALAGVVDDGDPPLTFALLVNVPPPAAVPAEVGQLQRSVAEVLAGWPRGPDLGALGPIAEGG